MPICYIPWLERPVISNVPAAVTMATSMTTSPVSRTTQILPANMNEVPAFNIQSSISSRMSATMATMASTVTSLATRATQSIESNPDYHVQTLEEQAKSAADDKARLSSQLHGGGIVVLAVGGTMVFIFLIAFCCNDRRRRNKERYNVPRAVDVDGVMVEVPRPGTDQARSASRARAEELQRQEEREYYAGMERERIERALRREVARIAKEERSTRKAAEKGSPSFFERLRGHGRQPDVVQLADNSVEMQLAERLRGRSGGSIQVQDNTRNIHTHPRPAAQTGLYRNRNAASSPPPEYRVYPRSIRVDSPTRASLPMNRARSSPSISLLELPGPADSPGPSRVATPPPMYNLHRRDRIASLEQYQDVAHAAEGVADVEGLPPYPAAAASHDSPPVSVPARQEPQVNLEEMEAAAYEELIRRSMRVPPIIYFDSPRATDETGREDDEEGRAGPSGNRNMDRLNWHL